MMRPKNLVVCLAGPPAILSPAEDEALVQLRDEAQRGVRTHAAQARSYLTHAHPAYRETGLHAVLHLAVASALPLLSQLAAREGRSQEKYHVAHAWLQAERESIPEKKVRRLLSTLKLDKALLNQATAVPLPVPGLDQEESLPCAFYVLRALADLAYRYPEHLGSLPELWGVNFAADVSANTRWRYASVPRKERVGALVKELSKLQIGRAGDPYPYIEQLLLDEGEAGRRALQQALAAKRLPEIARMELGRTVACSQPGKRRQMVWGY